MQHYASESNGPKKNTENPLFEFSFCSRLVKATNEEARKKIIMRASSM
jgi:hypothetical protein